MKLHWLILLFFKHWPDSYEFNTNPRGVCVIIDCVGNDGGETFSTSSLFYSILVVFVFSESELSFF